MSVQFSQQPRGDIEHHGIQDEREENEKEGEVEDNEAQCFLKQQSSNQVQIF